MAAFTNKVGKLSCQTKQKPGSHRWLPGFDFDCCRLPPRLGQRIAARVNGVLAELLLDAEER